MNSKTLFNIATCGLAAAFLLSGGGASAESVKRAKKAELDKVKAEIQERKDEIERLRKEEGRLEKDLVRISGRKEHALSRLSALKGELRAADRKLTELDERRETLEAAIDGWRGRLGLEAARLWRLERLDSPFHGRHGLWEQELRRGVLAEQAAFITGLETARSRAGTDHEAASRRRTALEGRSSEQAQAARREAAELEARKAELERAQKGRKDMLAEVRRLEESAEALDKFLAALDKKSRRAREREPRRETAALGANSLPWPVDGTPVEFFGKQRVSGLDTWVIRQGIRIQTQAGAEVRPVRGGTVLYAGPFRSYGTMVIVDHGSGLFSVYGSLDRVARAKGDKVDRTDVIGWAGRGDGARADGALYFEVRRDGQPVDPLAWLQKR